VKGTTGVSPGVQWSESLDFWRPGKKQIYASSWGRNQFVFYVCDGAHIYWGWLVSHRVHSGSPANLLWKHFHRHT
jgi:hypothetical protein